MSHDAFTDAVIGAYTMALLAAPPMILWYWLCGLVDIIRRGW